eukprot:2762074-Prymnesium_polylepis.1
MKVNVCGVDPPNAREPCTLLLLGDPGNTVHADLSKRWKLHVVAVHHDKAALNVLRNDALVHAAPALCHLQSLGLEYATLGFRCSLPPRLARGRR